MIQQCARRASFALVAIVILVGYGAVRCGAADSPSKKFPDPAKPPEKSKSNVIFGVGAKWTGTENWTRPDKPTLKTNATFEITERSGKKFTAEYRVKDQRVGNLGKGLDVRGEYNARGVTIKKSKFLEGTGPQHFTGTDILDLQWAGKVSEDGSRLTIRAKHSDGTIREFDGTR